LQPEEILATPDGSARRNWRGVLSQSWRSTDLVYVISRKVLLSYALVVGFCTLLLLAWEVSETRQTISSRHSELQRATSKAISEALWTYNDSLLNSIVFGLTQDETVTGARIRSADSNTAYEHGLLTSASAGWDSLLSGRYTSRWPIFWRSVRGDELIGHLELETSKQVIDQHLIQRMLMVLLSSTFALLSLFAVFFVIIRQQVLQPILVLARLMKQYKLGAPGHSTDSAQRAAGEIRTLYDAFQNLEDKLRAAHGQLTVASSELARQLDEQAAELSRAHARNMTLEISRAQESERRRLMRDMHDGFGSELASARIAVERGTLSQSEIVTFLSKCITDLHLIINVTGNECGKLEESIADWRYRVSRQLAGESFRLVWEVNLQGSPQLTQRAALQVLRIAQEALLNATRHSGASEIRIKVGHAEGVVNLIVSDNGRGLLPSGHALTNNRGKGLASMRSRAREIGASLDISFDDGCTIALSYRPDPKLIHFTSEEGVGA
jgi:signal transduction histidine kinase